MPNRRTSPSRGATSVLKMRNSVVLPPPLGPSKPKISPLPTSKLTLSNAVRSTVTVCQRFDHEKRVAHGNQLLKASVDDDEEQ